MVSDVFVCVRACNMGFLCVRVWVCVCVHLSMFYVCAHAWQRERERVPFMRSLVRMRVYFQVASATVLPPLVPISNISPERLKAADDTIRTVISCAVASKQFRRLQGCVQTRILLHVAKEKKIIFTETSRKICWFRLQKNSWGMFK